MLTEEFKDAVTAKDKDAVKLMLKNSLSLDLTFESFKEMLNYAVKEFPQLIEEHNSEEFLPIDKWDEAYTNLLKVRLIKNFSAERIEHLKEVQEYVYADALKQQLLDGEAKEAKRNIEPEQDTSNIKTLIATLGTATASIIVGVINNLSIVKVATTAAIATVVVGSVTYYIVKKK